MEAAEYAVFAHDANISRLNETFRAVLDDWLPASGRALADAPSLETYNDAFDPRTGDGGVKLWMPLRPTCRDLAARYADVMPGLVPGIHVVATSDWLRDRQNGAGAGRRGWPGQARPRRQRRWSSDRSTDATPLTACDGRLAAHTPASESPPAAP